LRLTHQDLAAMIGATRQTVTVTLNRFRDDGLIAIGERRITTLDELGLQRIAGRADESMEAASQRAAALPRTLPPSQSSSGAGKLVSFDGSRISRRQFLRASASAGLSLPMAERLARFAWATPATTQKNVADVLRFAPRPREWKGLFGFVTFRLHPVFYNRQRAYHIRTDASDQRFAREIGVVWVPKLAAAASEASADDYLLTNGTAGQLPVASTIPREGDFTPAYRLHRVTFKGTPKVLGSVQRIKDAETAGDVTVAATNIVVNDPVVKWPGGELSADTTQRQL
jgi:hypothetical protein